jgi:hypothetical protein
MIVARLIDTEGVTVANMALNDPPERPRPYVYTAATPKPCVMVDPADPLDTVAAFQTIEYRLERRDGGGTFIYRRVTGPWG